MSRRDSIESLQQELERLSLASNNIKRTILRLERQEQEQVFSSAPAHPSSQQVPPRKDRPTDRDGHPINVGARVTFLTRGRFRSTEGTVTRFSRNSERFFAQDDNGNEIPRAPRNVRIIYNVL